jgi:hypothetical protein
MAGVDLGKQVGPLPLGVWIVVGAGGLGLGYVINKNMAKNAAAATAPGTQLAETGVGVGGGQFQYDPIQTVPADTVPETNQTWGIKAANWLKGKGLDAYASDNAIRKYLSAQSLTLAEQGMINLVLGQFGVPPEPLPPVEVTPTPEPKPPTTTIKVPAVTGLTAVEGPRRVTFRWNYSGVAIAGFFITIKDLKRGRIVRSLYVSAKARNYTYTAPANWTRSSRSKVQIWIRPFRGGWSQSYKIFGDGRGASGTPII